MPSRIGALDNLLRGPHFDRFAGSSGRVRVPLDHFTLHRPATVPAAVRRVRGQAACTRWRRQNIRTAPGHKPSYVAPSFLSPAPGIAYFNLSRPKTSSQLIDAYLGTLRGRVICAGKPARARHFSLYHYASLSITEIPLGREKVSSRRMPEMKASPRSRPLERPVMRERFFNWETDNSALPLPWLST